MRMYKYTLPKPEEGEGKKIVVEMPKGAEIKVVRNVLGKVRVFALVDPDLDVEERHFEIWPTGVEIPQTKKMVHLHVFFNGSGNAFHVFERKS